MQSKLYTCPICGGPVDIDVEYDEDEEFGEIITLKVHCEKCQETREDDLIDYYTADDLRVLVGKLGT